MRFDEDTLYRRLAGDPPPATPLTGPHETEVLVIGGGLAGLTTALCLAEAGRQVTLIEARRVGFGASGRNGGILGYGFPLEWDEIAARLGQAEAREFLRLGRAGQSFVKDAIARHAIDCGPHPQGYLCGAWHDQPQAGRDYVAKQNERFGLELRWLSRDELAAEVTTPRYHGGFLDPAVSQIQPQNALPTKSTATRTARPRIRLDGCNLAINVPVVTQVIRVSTAPKGHSASTEAAPVVLSSW